MTQGAFLRSSRLAASGAAGGEGSVGLALESTGRGNQTLLHKLVRIKVAAALRYHLTRPRAS